MPRDQDIPWEPLIPTDQLPKLTFPAVYKTSTFDQNDKLSYGDFTLHGLVTHKHQPFKKPYVTNLVRDPGSKELYSLGNHVLLKVDLTNETSESLKPSDDLLDSKRQRFVIPDGFRVFAYSLKERKWSVLADTRIGGNTSLCAMAYSAKDDRLYAISQAHRPPELRLCVMNPYGALLKRIPLKHAFFSPEFLQTVAIEFSSGSAQLVSVDEYLALLLTRDQPGIDRFDEHHIFLIDPKTAKVQLTAQRIDHVQPMEAKSSTGGAP
jgi:hypothetical protein